MRNTVTTVTGVLTSWKDTHAAVVDVLEYFEAQMHMDLWKNKPVQKAIFGMVINNAIRELQKTGD